MGEETDYSTHHICDGQWRYYCEACSGLPDDRGIRLVGESRAWRGIETLSIGDIGLEIDLKHDEHEWTIHLHGIEASPTLGGIYLETGENSPSECVDKNFEWKPHNAN